MRLTYQEVALIEEHRARREDRAADSDMGRLLADWHQLRALEEDIKNLAKCEADKPERHRTGLVFIAAINDILAKHGSGT